MDMGLRSRPGKSRAIREVEDLKTDNGILQTLTKPGLD